MATCPDCNSLVPDSSKNCPNCGADIIPASTLEKISTKTTTWQKILIILSIIILIAIGFTFDGAEKREDEAAQNSFARPVAEIIASAATHSGLANIYGIPGHTLKADTKSAEIFLQFPGGPLSARQAQFFGNSVCGMVARSYVNKGYMPRQITVAVASTTPNGQMMVYGTSHYNGNTDTMTWQPEAQ